MITQLADAVHLFARLNCAASKDVVAGLEDKWVGMETVD
jgi:hypothetical protein